MATTWGKVRTPHLPRLSLWWTVVITMVLTAALVVSLLSPRREARAVRDGGREGSARTGVRPGGASGCRVLVAIPKRGWVCVESGPYTHRARVAE